MLIFVVATDDRTIQTTRDLTDLLGAVSRYIHTGLQLSTGTWSVVIACRVFDKNCDSERTGFGLTCMLNLY